MNETDKMATWNLLRDFGFQPDDRVWSDVPPGLSFDFGDFNLSASWVVSMKLAEVVLFSGVLATSRTLGAVSFELPRKVNSRELCAALIVHYLDNAAEKGVFHPAREVAWVTEGRKHRHLLPWEVSKSAYQARSHCTVQRDWLRLALKSMVELLAKADDAAVVEFSFDGSVLLIRCC